MREFPSYHRGVNAYVCVGDGIDILVKWTVEERVDVWSLVKRGGVHLAVIPVQLTSTQSYPGAVVPVLCHQNGTLRAHQLKQLTWHGDIPLERDHTQVEDVPLVLVSIYFKTIIFHIHHWQGEEILVAQGLQESCSQLCLSLKDLLTGTNQIVGGTCRKKAQPANEKEPKGGHFGNT